MSEENKALARRFYAEVVNGRNLDAIDEMVADDFVEHEALPGMPTDKEAPRQFFGMFHAAVPDLQADIEDIIAEGDKVVVRAVARGTHQGELMGMPATGKPFEIEWVDIVKVRDGKAIAHWGVTDVAGMMQQVGLIEGAPAAG
jgi:steroid delta-isomerase-like uncharacterized protein